MALPSQAWKKDTEIEELPRQGTSKREIREERHTRGLNPEKAQAEERPGQVVRGLERL